MRWYIPSPPKLTIKLCAAHKFHNRSKQTRCRAKPCGVFSVWDRGPALLLHIEWSDRVALSHVVKRRQQAVQHSIATARAANIRNAVWLPSMVPVTMSPGNCTWAAARIKLTTDVPTAPSSCWVVLIPALPSAFSSTLSWRRPLVMLLPIEQLWPKAKKI